MKKIKKQLRIFENIDLKMNQPNSHDYKSFFFFERKCSWAHLVFIFIFSAP